MARKTATSPFPSTAGEDLAGFLSRFEDLVTSLREGADPSQADTQEGIIRNARAKRTPAKRTARTPAKRTPAKRTPAKRTTKRTPVGAITCAEAWQALGSDPTYTPSEPNALARNGQLWALNAAGKLALLD